MVGFASAAPSFQPLFLIKELSKAGSRNVSNTKAIQIPDSYVPIVRYPAKILTRHNYLNFY